MKVTVIIEKASDGRYSCFAEEEFDGFGLAGYGDTVAEAKLDLEICRLEMQQLEAEKGNTVPEMDFVYKYDISSFFNCFPYLNAGIVAERAGISAAQMRQYTCGAAHPGQKQYEKLRNAVMSIIEELSAATF